MHGFNVVHTSQNKTKQNKTIYQIFFGSIQQVVSMRVIQFYYNFIVLTIHQARRINIVDDHEHNIILYIMMTIHIIILIVREY